MLAQISVDRIGSNVVVAGTAIFGAQDPAATIQQMRESINKERAAVQKA